jgi:diaminohydroxyphosphoribosylaminopyrimidine deaminase/5-amino-6-(5-phosphoribosylamino)uracil reductase
LLDARLIDEVRVSVAPTLVGGANAPGPIGGVGSQRLGDALRVAEWSVEQVAEDVFIRGRVVRE